jgi:hypothetical protein
MADVPPGLVELCEAIKSGDAREIARCRKEFAGKNWSLVSTIDQLANADAAAGHHESAAAKFGLIEELLPHAGHFFLRRVSSQLRTGVPGTIEELGSSSARLTDDGQLFHAAEELVANGRSDLAATLVDACKDRGGFSPGILAAAQSRVLATTGRLREAIELLNPEMATNKPNLTAMRCQYLLLEQILDFEAFTKVCARAALLWGEERELRHLVERLVYLFDYETATRVLRDVAKVHSVRAELANVLTAQMSATKATSDAALAEHGPVQAATAADIFAALSESGVPVSRVLWAKQALVALLDSDRLTEADYARFAWYLPNWEQGQIRNHVLAVARRRFPDAPQVQRGWLHYLVSHSAYADAAKHCMTLLHGQIDEDSMFFVIGLLRLQKDGIVPSFMEPDVFETLRADLLARVKTTGPAFRCVMHDHIVALGGTSEGWPDDAILPLNSPDARGFRRLFAITTGRLARVTAVAPTGQGGPIRPVVAISGQLRGFETSWASLHEHLCRPTGAPVVMSVWDKSVNATGRHASRLERALPEDIVARLRPEERYTDAFEKAYPDTYKLLFGHTDVDAFSLRTTVEQSGCDILAIETESESHIASIMPPHVSPNMLKMYYKFSRLEALIQEAERLSGNLFSHVIWSRPDCQIIRLSPNDLNQCLARSDIVWSSFTTETSFGDYVMVLPRRAFATIASIFPRVITAGDTRLMPWRPNRSVDPNEPVNLDAFGGPDVFFDVLLADGYIPLARIPRMILRLLGRTPGPELVRRTFENEQRKSRDTQASQ